MTGDRYVDDYFRATLHLVIIVPPAGDRPSEFRAKFVAGIRESASRAYSSGRLPAELLEEIYRAVPTDEPRQ